MMSNLDQIFLESLAFFLKERGSARRLSLKTGIDSSYITMLSKGVRYGSEDTRRKIAAALGYPGPKYEEFLDIGRKALGLTEAQDFAPPLVIPSWLEALLPDMVQLDKPGQESIKALLKGLKKPES
jgi:hypothetical protein